VNFKITKNSYENKNVIILKKIEVESELVLIFEINWFVKDDQRNSG